jgi:F420 biosynthesis protein FbiB-like protein
MQQCSLPALALLASRQTIRRFRPEEVPTALAERLIDAAARAPSAHNRQPWRFCVVRTPQRKLALAESMGQRLRADRERDGDDQAAIEADLQRSRARIVEAPMLVLVCASMEDMDRYPDPVRAHAEQVMAIQSTAMAGENLLLAAAAEGLGGCWMCAPLFCPEEVRSALDLPESWSPQGLVLVGYPAEPGRQRPRKERASIVTFR